MAARAAMPPGRQQTVHKSSAERLTRRAVTRVASSPVALVSGASRGLGRAIALRLAASGYRVVVHYHVASRAADRVRHAIRQTGGTAIDLPADLRDYREVDRLVSTVLQQWHQIDLLVHNAGITQDGLIPRMGLAAWEEVIATNLTGAFHLLQLAGRAMVSRRRGQMLLIGSMAGVMGRAGQSNYAAAKAGLIALTKTAAREWGPFNIRVNCVLPGYLPTAMGRRLRKDQRQRLMHDALLKHRTTLAEAARSIVDLTGMEQVSGQLFNLDSRLL